MSQAEPGTGRGGGGRAGEGQERFFPKPQRGRGKERGKERGKGVGGGAMKVGLVPGHAHVLHQPEQVTLGIWRAVMCALLTRGHQLACCAHSLVASTAWHSSKHQPCNTFCMENQYSRKRLGWNYRHGCPDNLYSIACVSIFYSIELHRRVQGKDCARILFWGAGGGGGGGSEKGGGEQGVLTWEPRARQPSARGTLWRGEAMAPVKPYKALAVSFKAFWRESRTARLPAAAQQPQQS